MMRSKTSAAFLRLDELAGGMLDEIIDTSAAVAARLGFDDGYETGKRSLARWVGWYAAPHVPEELKNGWVYEVVIHELVRRCEREAASRRRKSGRRPPQRGRAVILKVSKGQKVKA